LVVAEDSLQIRDGGGEARRDWPDDGRDGLGGVPAALERLIRV